jgi:hypoxanthine phosphoribosyltransferase
MRQEILISQETISARIRELALQISADHEGKEPVVVGILNGSVFFLADIVREMTIPVKIDFIRAKSYGAGTSTSGVVTMTKGLELPVKDRPVILVEDIVDTGLTLSRITDIIREKCPESIRICALIDKEERRETGITIDYCGFKVKEGFLVGYGLDYDEQYRCLKDICVLYP